MSCPIGPSGTASPSPKLNTPGAPLVWADSTLLLYMSLDCYWQVNGGGLPRPVSCKDWLGPLTTHFRPTHGGSAVQGSSPKRRASFSRALVSLVFCLGPPGISHHLLPASCAELGGALARPGCEARPEAASLGPGATQQASGAP